MKLTCNALACERNGRVVFSNLHFSLASGEMAELRGPNGAGKSSLLRLLAGLVPKAAGEITLDPAPEDDLRHHCHYIGHQDALKNSMTVAENLRFWSRMLGGTEGAAALAAFNLEKLKDDPVQLLSAGQRRRLALSRLLVAPRSLWLLDEPTTALDQASQTILARAMDRHLKGGGMVLAATHGDLPLQPHHVITLGGPA